jgi:putative oxidoreductase
MNSWVQLPALVRGSDAALLFARLATGIFLVDGVLDNILSGERMAEFVGFLSASGFAMPGFWAPFSVYTQFAIGIALILGLLIRWAALGLIVTFIVGIVMVHLNQSLREIWPALALVALGGVFATQGAGRWSLDALFGKRA